jgi:[acyl-carrier-protein] S-malonyltransferase
MKTCFLFPGQGAQYPGMGMDLWEQSPSVRTLFERASEAAGMDMRRLLSESTAQELQATDKAQPAITLVNLSASAVLREKGVALDGCAGFSLGEYAALCEAGVISVEDLFPIVKARGSCMEEAARSLDTESGKPGMAAVLGLHPETVAAIVEPLAKAGVYLANYNSPGQVVLSGSAAGLAKAETALKEAGAKRFILLKVSGPFHCPLMEGAAKVFADALAGYSFSDPRAAVYSNVTGKAIRTGAEAKELCVRQVVSMVRWVTVEESLFADGFTRFVEAGPGTVLAGLMRALRPDTRCAPAGRMDEIAAASAAG